MSLCVFVCKSDFLNFNFLSIYLSIYLCVSAGV